MESKCLELRGEARIVLREALRTAVPALLALVISFGLAGVTRSEARPTGEETAPLCGEWHRGGRESRALDLVGVKRAYESLRARVGQALEHEVARAQADFERPYDAGLPACRDEAARSVPLAKELGLPVRGRVLYFVAVGDPEELRLPREIEQNPAAQVLILRMRHWGDLGKIAEHLGRPVSLASAAFAQALGVRCAGTWLKISENGDEIELHEVP